MGPLGAMIGKLRRLASAAPRPPAFADLDRQPWWLGAPILIGTVLAYLPVWHAGLVWDDRSFIMDNPLIHRPDGPWTFWFTTKPVDYYPVTWTMWWVEWRLWGANPVGYHVLNVLLHAVGALFLWRLLALLLIPGAWLAAAIFAVHPVNVESVAWIAERKNLLALVFFLASLSCFVRARSPAVLAPSSDSHAVSRRAAVRAWCWYAGALAAFLAALLSKTVVAPMPFVLLGLMAWRLRGRVKLADVLYVVPFFALAAAVGMISLWFQTNRAIGADTVRADGFWARLAGAGWAFWFYAYKAVLPFGLRSIYPRWQIDAGQWWSYLPALFAAAVLGACWHARGVWAKGLLATFLYFALMLSPVLGFLNIGFMKFSLVADHWQYFAIIGPIALVAAAIARGFHGPGQPGRPLVAAAVSAMLVGLGVLTWRQTERYRDPETFWGAALASDPGSWAAHNNLGGFLVERGRLDEAIPHFKSAVEIRPGYATAQYNLGAALREKGRLPEALVHLRRAVDIQPDHVEARNALARALASNGDWDGAMEHLERSLAADPAQGESHNNLGNVLWRKGRLREAAAEYERALALHPRYAAAHFNLGEVLRLAGEARAAVAHYRSALQITPDLLAALDSLAWILSTSPDAEVRDGTQAVMLAGRAERISRGTDPRILGTLAAAYAENGRFPEAVAIAQRASSLAAIQGKPDRIERLQAQIALYQRGAPYRDVRGRP